MYRIWPPWFERLCVFVSKTKELNSPNCPAWTLMDIFRGTNSSTFKFAGKPPDSPVSRISWSPKEPITLPTLKNDTISLWKWIVGRLPSFWECLFSGAFCFCIFRSCRSWIFIGSALDDWKMDKRDGSGNPREPYNLGFYHGDGIHHNEKPPLGKFGRMCVWNFFLASTKQTQDNEPTMPWGKGGATHTHTHSVDFQKKTTVN